MSRKSSGFSLIELMIVVSIIGVLAAVAIPTYTRYKTEARRAEALNILPEFMKAEMAYYTENNTCSLDPDDLLFDAPTNSTYYLYQVCNKGTLAIGTGNKYTGASSYPGKTDGCGVAGESCDDGCTLSGATAAITVFANGQLDADNAFDNVSIAERQEICVPGVCTSLNTASGCTDCKYDDDVELTTPTG